MNNSHRQRAMSSWKVVIRRRTIGFGHSNHAWMVYTPTDGQSYGFWDYSKALRFTRAYVKREKDKAKK